MKDENAIMQPGGDVQRSRWQEPIDLEKWLIKLEHSAFFRFNYPILFLTLSFWGGILGGVWFAYRGRFVFGTFIWPVISVCITLLVCALFALPICSDLTFATWFFSLGYLIKGITQLTLAVVAHTIYSRWLTKHIKAGKYKEVPISKTKGAISLVILLFVILPLLYRLLGLS